MPGSGLGFAVLEIIIFILAVSLFAYNTWYKIKLVRQGQPEWEKRWNKIPQRIKTFILEVIGHQKQFRDWYAGPMHFMIFWGFIILFLAIVNFFWEGLGISPEVWQKIGLGVVGKYVNGTALPFTEGFAWYHILMNIFFVLVLIAMAMAFYRRLVIRPERLELTTEALLILVLISGVIITDVMIEGAKIVQAKAVGEAGLPGAFFSALMAKIWQGVGVKTEHSAKIAYATSWWLHCIILLGFLKSYLQCPMFL